MNLNKIKTAVKTVIINTMSADLDESFAETEALLTLNQRQGDLIESLNAEAAQLNETLEEAEAAAEVHLQRINELRSMNDELAQQLERTQAVVAKQATKLSAYGEADKTVVNMDNGESVSLEELGKARMFLDKARANPIRTGLELLLRPVKINVLVEHGRATPQAWTIQRTLSEVACAAWRQRKWNRDQVATTRGKLKEMLEAREQGETVKGSIQFFEEREVWEEDLVAYWDDVLRAAKNLHVEELDSEWSPPSWLTKPRNEKPAGKPEVSGKDTVRALKEAQRKAAGDII